MEAKVEQAANEIKRLKTCINNLISVGVAGSLPKLSVLCSTCCRRCWAWISHIVILYLSHANGRVICHHVAVAGFYSASLGGGKKSGVSSAGSLHSQGLDRLR